jgi:amicyanin
MKYALFASLLMLVAWGCDRGREVAIAAPPATAPSDPASPQQVSIDNFAFSPASITVAVGTRVTWINRDDVPHTVTSSTKDKVLKSAALDTDETYSFVFTKPGVFDYYCAVHPHMTGQVIVKP